MKIVYNSKEISNSTDNYNSLLNLPMINSSVLQGVKTLNDVNAYSKQQVDELIGNSRAIEIVTALPTNLIENTLYYVGPDANDFYDVYLVDEVRNVINIGTSQFGEYYGGTGIEIDDDNYIHAKIDNKTIIVDSEGNLHANIDMDVVPNFIGATSTTNGVKGLVPQPAIGNQTKYLKGNGTWANILDAFRPVGSIYLGYANQNPSTLFPGTTWTQLSTNRALWTTSTSTTTIAAGLPPITGTFRIYPAQGAYDGAFGVSSKSGGFSGYVRGGGSWGNVGSQNHFFSASSSNPIYGNSTTVQPAAIKICAWQRTA